MFTTTFLTEEQIFNDSSKLEIFKKCGAKAALTDFSILLGAYVSGSHTDEGDDLKYRTGWYWTQTHDGSGDARAVIDNGDRDIN